jgi:CheY-like chemotaxis protein
MSQILTLKHLAILGIDAKLASNGEEALSLLEQHDFDAVLMDIHMPVMNGIEATTLIRRQEKFATLPIIALSAGVTQLERNNCMDCGMVGFIAKPIDVEQLHATLELWLSKPQ